ncbi:AraC family transcriptional regulator (plasmid) [Rhizobium acidisoli]|uniref:AraC family transcriptional regulator n=1 Tax=Rhizobium acidisoli TaxID=1538158 RepID=A0AAE6C2F2_9HYPH|nr:helix-turn-helix transcriptional regulator [Rhizobium acidisoli]QAS81328.1 AraC family transcriptional regulator [Rhizobium acidisoli]
MSALGDGFNTNLNSFEAATYEAASRDLSFAEPTWRWSVAAGPDKVCSLKFRRLHLPATSITSVEHSIKLEGVARRNPSRITIFFVLAGQIEANDRHKRTSLLIPAGHVASVCEGLGNRVAMDTSTSWLAFHVPQYAMRRYFEDLTGRPYVQEFNLPLISFRHGDAEGLYQTLRQAEADLNGRCSQAPALAKAYQQLALVKLFTKMPSNLCETLERGTPGKAPWQLLKAEAFMLENLGNPITLDQLAGIAGCAPRVLQRLFRTFRGDSPMGVLCTLRLAAAHSTIRSRNLISIGDLACRLQFSNPGRFSVLYKKAYGCSPSSTFRFASDSVDERRMLSHEEQR